jgi:hypothetical protein
VAKVLYIFQGNFKLSDEVLDVLCAVLVDAFRFAQVEGIMMQERLPIFHVAIMEEVFQNALHAAHVSPVLQAAMVSFDPKDLWDLAYLNIDDIQDPYELTAGPGSVTRGKRWLVEGALQADDTGELELTLPAFLDTQPVISEDPSFTFHRQREKADSPGESTGPWGLFPGMTRSLSLLQATLSNPHTEEDKLCIYTLLLQYFRLAMDVSDTWTAFYRTTPAGEPFLTARQVSFALDQARWNWEAETRDPLSPIPIRTRRIMAQMNFEGNFRFLCDLVAPRILLDTRDNTATRRGDTPIIRILGYYLYRFLWRDCINSLHDTWGFLVTYREMRSAMGLQVSPDTTRWRPPPFRAPTIDFGLYEYAQSEIEEEDAGDRMDVDPASPDSDTGSLWEEYELTPDVELDAFGERRCFEDCSRVMMDPPKDIECPFCLEEGEQGEDIFVEANSCKHAFHMECLETWLNGVHKGHEYVQCPVCRAPLCTPRALRPMVYV